MTIPETQLNTCNLERTPFIFILRTPQPLPSTLYALAIFIYAARLFGTTYIHVHVYGSMCLPKCTWLILVV